MDKRLKPKAPAHDADIAMRDAFYEKIRAGTLTIGEAVAAMREISKLTQPEFARHRGISVQSLRQIESGKGNPAIGTLNKISSIFGLEAHFVPKKRHPKS